MPSQEELTPREVSVMQLLCEGLSQVAIGQRLFLTLNTVKTHLGAAYVKLGAFNAAGAVTAYLGGQLSHHFTSHTDPCQDRGCYWPCDVAIAFRVLLPDDGSRQAAQAVYDEDFRARGTD